MIYGASKKACLFVSKFLRVVLCSGVILLATVILPSISEVPYYVTVGVDNTSTTGHTFIVFDTPLGREVWAFIQMLIHLMD
jgi:hypothetical protein